MKVVYFPRYMRSFVTLSQRPQVQKQMDCMTAWQTPIPRQTLQEQQSLDLLSRLKPGDLAEKAMEEIRPQRYVFCRCLA